jgi:hypothetical protein
MLYLLFVDWGFLLFRPSSTSDFRFRSSLKRPRLLNVPGVFRTNFTQFFAFRIRPLSNARRRFAKPWFERYARRFNLSVRDEFGYVTESRLRTARSNVLGRGRFVFVRKKSLGLSPEALVFSFRLSTFT